MRAGEQAQSEPNQTREEPQNTRQEQPNGSSQESLLDFAAAMVTLVRQTWRDRFALAKAELRLAYNSVFLLIGLAVFSAMTLMLIWVLLLFGAGYYALQLGIEWYWVLLGMLVAQVLLAIYLRRQVRILARSFTFPETRRAFSSKPLSAPEPVPDPNPETRRQSTPDPAPEASR